MKIFIVTLGTRGDVQPYVALGRGLQAAGHSVTLCTCSTFESFITDYGLQYGYMNDGFMQFMKTDIARDAMENVNNLWAGIQYALSMWKQTAPLQRSMIADSWESAQKANPDLILFHPKAYGGVYFAEKLGIPAMMAFYLPLYAPTGEYPAIGFPQWKFGSGYNRFTYVLVHRITTLMTGRFIREWRVKNQMQAQPHRIDFLHTGSGKPIPILHGFSSHVVPVPSDWPDHVVATGYWFLDHLETWKPSPELLHFLGAGDPPVYVGFGSISGRNPQQITREIIEGLRMAYVRGVLASGWGGLSSDNDPETVFQLDAAPHDWLFPRMAAIVHHGGCGTTSACFRAGRPSIVCPFFGDQPYWGRRVYELGVGSKPIPQKKLHAENLATAIREVLTTPQIRQRAEKIGEKIRQEEGIANAVSFIEKMLTH